jgi:hypothetical protein
LVRRRRKFNISRHATLAEASLSPAGYCISTQDTLTSVAPCITNFITKEAAAFLSFKQVTVVWWHFFRAGVDNRILTHTTGVTKEARKSPH